jgi:hypothetical protein
MSEKEFEEKMQDLLFDAHSPNEAKTIRNFEDDGMPEDRHGVIIEYQDGSEFSPAIEKTKRSVSFLLLKKKLD